MEGQLQRTHDHDRHEEDDPHHQSVREGEVEAEHNHRGGEKKSVLTKVKNKAKKIKDKIKHAGHAQEDDDYDYDDDEETVNASHLDGAPTVNETDFISGTALPKQTGLNLENPTGPLDDRQSPSARDDDVHDDVGNVGATRSEMYPNIGMRTSPLLEDPDIRKQEYSLAGDVGVGTGTSPNTDLLDPLPTSTATTASDQRAHVAEPMVVKNGPLTDLEEDPHGPNTNPLPNYQCKVADPTGQGGAEADVAQLRHRLDSLHVEPETGSEERAYTQELINNPESFDAERAESMPRDTVAGKISAAAPVVTEKASSLESAAASKLGDSPDEEVQELPEKTALESASEYGHRVAEQLAPVYEKAAAAGSAIMARVQRRGGDEGGDGAAKESDRGGSVQEYLAEKFSPGEEDRELSKVITDAIHGKKELGAQPEVEKGRIEAVAGDEKAEAGVVDRVRGAIGSWLGKKQGDGEEGPQKEIASRLQE